MSQLTGLRYFLEVSKLGSIRAAAAALHVSPSAVSRMLAKLEHEYQTELFERRKHGMRLTQSGELLAAQLQSVFLQLRDARSQIDELRSLRRGEVRLYCIEGILSDVVPRVLSALHRRHPDISYLVYAAGSDGIADAIMRDEADIGITFNMERRPDLEVLMSHREPLCAVVAPQHPLAVQPKVSLKRLMQYRIAMPDASFGVRRLFDKALASNRLSPKILLTTNSIELTRSAARSGDAITFTPAFAVRREVARRDLVAIRIAEHKLLMGRMDVCIRRGRRLPAAAAELVEVIRATFDELKVASQA